MGRVQLNYGASNPDDFGLFLSNVDSDHVNRLIECSRREIEVPSVKHFEELRNKCKWTTTKMHGIDGYKITGSNGNSIFLPFSGHYNSKQVTGFGRLYTSESFYNIGDYTIYFYFNQMSYSLQCLANNCKLPIRLILNRVN